MAFRVPRDIPRARRIRPRMASYIPRELDATRARTPTRTDRPPRTHFVDVVNVTGKAPLNTRHRVRRLADPADPVPLAFFSMSGLSATPGGGKPRQAVNTADHSHGTPDLRGNRQRQAGYPGGHTCSSNHISCYKLHKPPLFRHGEKIGVAREPAAPRFVDA